MRPTTTRSLAPANRLGSRAAWKAVNGRARRTRRFPIPPRLIAIGLVVVLLVGAVALYVTAPSPVIILNGIAEGDVITRNRLPELAVVVAVDGADGVSMSVDGTEVPTTKTGELFVGRPQNLTGGEHVLEVSASGLPFKSASVQRRFTVDLSGPTLVLPEQIGAPAGQTVILTGAVNAAVAVTVDGRAVPIVRGRFDIGLPAGDRPVTVAATDARGVTEQRRVTLTTKAVASTYPLLRAVHITSTAWAEPGLREPVLELARQGRINAVQLDIKDESGIVGYASKVPLAQQAGATAGLYDAAAAIQELRSLGVRVVGRIVCFLDPKLAAHAQAGGKTNQLILDQAGTAPYRSGYGEVAFTNFADPAVQQYNIDLAVEAVGLGFDEILYDYVRRPDGPFETMKVPGLTVDPAIVVAGFVRSTQEALARAKAEAKFGISVFGISATRPQPIAQDMRLLLPWVDYISPMVYPSHWGRGEYGVANPNASPYDIVKRSLQDFHNLAYGTGVAIAPWLQAFSAGGITYGPNMVAAQIQAAAETGSPGFLLWNSGSRYDPAAIPPVPR